MALPNAYSIAEGPGEGGGGGEGLFELYIVASWRNLHELFVPFNFHNELFSIYNILA
jgi:hypothetical protein